MNRLNDTAGPNDPPPIPNNPEGLDILKFTVWGLLDVEANILFKRAGFRTLPFSPRILKKFNYRSHLHEALLSHQTEESLKPDVPSIAIPERSKQINRTSSNLMLR